MFENALNAAATRLRPSASARFMKRASETCPARGGVRLRGGL